MRVMVFGTFDRLHEGHRFFLEEARALGSELIAVVARDEVVLRLKGHIPAEDERERLRILAASGFADQAVLSDRQEGGYEVVKSFKPDIIALGYDQESLGTDLRRAMAAGKLPGISIRKIEPHKPEELHSSIL